ncbi:MAG: ABC transporter ATP-binding protein, partial [Dongiaceae bacterium]
MLFRIDNLVVHYNKVAALRGISLELGQGDIITLIGANGAGKSTTLRAISGLTRPSGGAIWFDGRRIDGLAAEKVVALGIAQVPEGRRVFPDLTVIENLLIGAFLRKDKDGIARDRDEVFGHFPRLAERRKQLAKTLSGGEQQMLAMGRALMSSPRLLLLDEPSLGLSPVMVREIARIVLEINRRGVPVILVEQNAEMALRLARYGYVLETGRIALEGPAVELHEHEHVRRAYLGG